MYQRGDFTWIDRLCERLLGDLTLDLQLEVQHYLMHLNTSYLMQIHV